VVATSSPDPTMDADNTNPGPMCLRLPRKVVGGSSILDGSSLYGSLQGRIGW
jgi:hypothetical protein